MASLAADEKRSGAVFRWCVDISSVLNQQSSNIEMAILAADEKRSGAVIRCFVDTSSALKHHRHQLKPAIEAAKIQHGALIMPFGIYVQFTTLFFLQQHSDRVFFLGILPLANTVQAARAGRVASATAWGDGGGLVVVGIHLLGACWVG